MIQNYLELEKTYVLGVYAKKELVLVKGKNAKIWDNHGNEYIDCVSGNGVANLGHANEKIARAVSEQAARLITCSNMFYNDQRALLLEKLIQITLSFATQEPKASRAQSSLQNSPLRKRSLFAPKKRSMDEQPLR